MVCRLLSPKATIARKRTLPRTEVIGTDGSVVGMVAATGLRWHGDNSCYDRSIGLKDFSVLSNSDHIPEIINVLINGIRGG
jgi:hypothetical protein